MSVLQKKGLSYLLGFLALLLLPDVHALIVPGIITNSLRSFFITIPEEWVFRFVLFIIVFALFYYSAYKVFQVQKEARNKSVAIIISIALALTSAILLPALWVMSIFQIYGGVIGIVLVLGPVIGLTYLGSIWKTEDKKSYTRWQRGFRATIFILGSYIMGMIGYSLAELNFLGVSPEVVKLDEIALFASFIFLCLAVWNTILALWGGTNTERGAGTEGSGKDKNDGSDGSGKNGNDGKNGGDGEDGKKGKSKKTGLPDDPSLFDPKNPCTIQIHVEDNDQNPVKGANIRLIPTGIDKRTGVFKKNKYYMEITGMTNPDGFWPDNTKAKSIPSGKYKLIVSAGAFSSHEEDLFPTGGEFVSLNVVLKKKGEKDEWFEPKIHYVRDVMGSNGQKATELTGRVE
ncbi:MAG: hypothetical protein V1725_03205 [archaeon]